MKQVLLFSFIIAASLFKSQSINSETVEFKVLKAPQTALAEGSRNFNVAVHSPYNLTKEDVVKQAKIDHQAAVAGFSTTLAESQADYQDKLKEYSAEIARAKDKFALESAEFKKLSLLERLSLEDKGMKPQLHLPQKPVYTKPSPPVYSDPNLNNYFIVDNNVLASQVSIDGFKRGNPNVDIVIDMQQVNFQDNAGQTFANQPTKLTVKENGVEKLSKTFASDFVFVSSSPTNNIDKASEERKVLYTTIKDINTYLNEIYGFKALSKNVKVEYVKNKGDYNDLEKAHIYVTTNLRKLQANSDQTVNNVAFANMKKGTDIWTETLKKINYTDKKAVLNAKIGKSLYLNLIRLNVALENNKDAEKFLNELQEKLVQMDLSYDEKNELKQLEKAIYH
ncbi:MAG: hypothetical protein K0M56_09350 [Kaistella sp.]|nr:hypothetical protein [Kaistella sp.]